MTANTDEKRFSGRIGRLSFSARGRWRAVCAAVLAPFIWVAPVLAAAGDLDPTFGSGGRVITDLFGGNDEAGAVALQPDGKIVVAGSAINPGTGNLDFALARHNPDGSLDSSFGSGGIVTTDFLGGDDSAEAIALQLDGKIIAAGHSLDPATGRPDFALARYNPDGSLDSSFGGGGKVRTDFFGDFDEPDEIVLQSDGKIIVAGRGSHPTTGNLDLALARYNPDGSLDLSFGSGGIVTTFLGGFGQANGISLQPDGKIVAAGLGSGTGGSDFALVRYNPDGSLDTGFGNGGKVTTDFFGQNDEAGAVALQPDGSIVAVGAAFNPATGSAYFALARYNPDGSLDSSFGSGGKVTTLFFGGGLADTDAVALQPDGKIVVAGVAFPAASNNGDFALARYNPDGSLDSSFGSGGIVTTDFFGDLDEVEAMVLQPDGKILVVGRANDPATGNFDFALARYLPDARNIVIDIKPASINRKSQGMIPVAILSSASFNAPVEVAAATLTFGHSGDEMSLAFCNANGKHVNKDGFRDLVCHFHTNATAFQVGDTQGILKGETKSGALLEGRDSVRIVPK